MKKEIKTLNIPDIGKKRIVIVGGGFGGVNLARKLTRSNYQVVLLDRNNFHLFQPLMYQVATGMLNSNNIVFTFRRLLRGKKNVHFRMVEVTGVDTEKKIVKSDLGVLEYDYLVLANGAVTNFFGMEEIERNSLQMKDISETLEIRNQVFYNAEKALTLPERKDREALLNIVIVGGGASGVELAGAFSDMQKYNAQKEYIDLDISELKIYLIEGGDRLLRNMSQKTSDGAAQQFEKAGIIVKLNTTAKGYEESHLVLSNGERIPTLNLIWASGVEVVMPTGLENASRPKGGRVETDMYLRAKGFEDIYVIGDASIQIDDKNPTGYPQLARVAMEQAKTLQRNFKRAAKGKEPREYKYVRLPPMATIRRNSAYTEFKYFRLSGFIGWVSWAAVHLFSVLGVRNRISVMWSWFWNYVTLDFPARMIISADPIRKKKSCR